MPDDVATLADTLVDPSGQPATATPDAATSGQPETAAATQLPDLGVNKDAADLGQFFLDQGYTKEQANELINAPKVLDQIRYQLENDPVSFLRELERTNPKVGEKLMETLADEYVNRYGDKEGKKAAQPAPTNEVEMLRQRLDQIERERHSERETARLASVRSRLEGRIDDLFNMDEVKKLGLSKVEQKLMRDSLDVQLGRDSQATQRVVNGNFVDVPKAFKSILDEWAADKRAVAAAAEEARKASQRASSFEFDSGPGMLGLPKEALSAFEKEIDSIWSGK